MQALSRWVVRNRLIVSLLWLAVTVVGVVIAPSVSGRLHSGVSLSSPACVRRTMPPRRVPLRQLLAGANFVSLPRLVPGSESVW